MDDVFGSDSSANEFDPAEEEADNNNNNSNHEEAPSGGAGALDSDGDGDDGDDEGVTGNEPAASPTGAGAALGGTGLSDSEDENDEAFPADADADAEKLAMDADVFGSDSEDEVAPPAASGSLGAENDDAAADVDPFEESDDEEGGSGGKTLGKTGGGRLSKGDSSGKGKGKGKKRKAGADGSSKSKRKKGTVDGGDGGGDNPTKKKKKKKKKKKDGDEGEEGAEGGGGKKATKKKKKKKGKKKKAKTTSVGSSTLQDLGLESSADEAAQDQDQDDDDLSDAEVEHEDEEDEGLGGDGGEEVARAPNKRTKEDDDFIDDADDNADLLNEYKQDAPEGGDHSEAEEDNNPEDFHDAPKKESAMTAVLASMKKRKAQDLSTAEREQIAQEFMFKINQAAEDDEEAVQNKLPAIHKLKMSRVLKATLAKKELQETFLEFDLLGVLKRWLQPYSNGQLPNLTVRRDVLELIDKLPVQVDHLKRSGIGKVVMGLLNCREETTDNKRTLRGLVSKWNRPVYEKETNYRARRPAQDDLEAMEVPTRGGGGAAGSGGRRRVIHGSMRRDGASRDEAVGNILNARARGLDPTKSRVPFSNGYAFSKAPRSRVEGHGRAPAQQVDTSSRAKLLKKMATLARPVNKSA
ncbi:unnamed protein product [Ectocarpus fasciculatus]